MHEILNRFAAAAADQHATARAWKAATGGKVVGTFPMHFPAEVIHAAGALPVILGAASRSQTTASSRHNCSRSEN
jgi:benzoyl-CoA reductase subunit C